MRREQSLQKIYRAHTPGVETYTFLNSAGSSLMPMPVVSAMKDYLDLEASIGGYAAASREQNRINALYQGIARLINCSPGEVAIMGNATLAWQMAFYSFAFKTGDRILTVQSEYAANYVAYLHAKQKFGVTIDVIPNNQHGEVDVEALIRMLDERVKLISVTWIPTNGGLINPVSEIGRIAHANGIVYLVDACQAVGQIPIDVQEIQCDILSATGRKFLRGPRGIGFLYVRESLLDTLHPPMIDHFSAPWTSVDTYTLRPDTRRFETWESNYSARIGLGVAVEYLLKVGVGTVSEIALRLSDKLRKLLGDIPGIRVADLGKCKSAIVSFELERGNAQEFVSKAELYGIMIGVSNPSSTLLDSEARSLPVLVRASPHYFNNDDDLKSLSRFCFEYLQLI
jgi:cysteine desulfurase/selenocysteine lyase